MSWFTDIAGKAENLLNKFDQNAASVLKQNSQLSGSETDPILSVENCLEIQTNKTSLPGSPLRMTKKPQSIDFPSDGNRDWLSTNGTASQSKSGSNSNSRRSSISSKSSRAGTGTVIEKPIENSCSQMNGSTPTFDIINDFQVSVEHELAATKIVLNEMKSERDELKCELDSLTEHLKNESSQSMIKELQETCNELMYERTNLIENVGILKKSNSNYIKSISELETKLSKMIQVEADTNVKLEWAKKEAEQATSELQQYRAKAQKTLQMKDQLINELKANQADNFDGNRLTSETANSIEIDNLKLENTNLVTERNMLSQQLEDIRIYVAKLEEMHKEQQIEFEKRLHAVNQNLKQDERKWIQYEDEYRAQMKELNTLRDEMNRLQMDSSTKLREKDQEINQLKTRLTQKSYVDFSNDLEERVQSLTQSLVQKQNSLEVVTADRNALRFQLEKIENQHRNTMIQLRQQRPQIINVNDTDDAKAQLPMFMQENPFDTRVARRVKRAYSSLDSLGVRFGVFLRRYPLIRILAIFYVALLHFWVILVLFSSRPT